MKGRVLVDGIGNAGQLYRFREGQIVGVSFTTNLPASTQAVYPYFISDDDGNETMARRIEVELIEEGYRVSYTLPPIGGGKAPLQKKFVRAHSHEAAVVKFKATLNELDAFRVRIIKATLVAPYEGK